MRWEREPWRKLYVREEGSFATLPLYVRALAAELLKFADDLGRIHIGNMDPADAVARRAGANRSDRRLLKEHMPLLIADGYCSVDGEWLVIRNWSTAQTRRIKQPDSPSSGGDALGDPDRDRATARPRQSNGPTTTEQRPDHDRATGAVVSMPNDYDPDAENGHTRARESKRIEENRRESVADAPSAAEQAELFAEPDAPQTLRAPEGHAAPSAAKAPHRRVVDAYFAAYQRVRGTSPIFEARDGKAVKALLGATKSADRAIEIIESAMADEFFANTDGTIRSIAGNPSRFLGKRKLNGARASPAPRGQLPGDNPGWIPQDPTHIEDM